MAKKIPFPGKQWGREMAFALAKPMKNRIYQLDRAELEALIATCKQFTDTNCGWVEYHCKDAIIKLASSRLFEITPISEIKRRNLKS